MGRRTMHGSILLLYEMSSSRAGKKGTYPRYSRNRGCAYNARRIWRYTYRTYATHFLRRDDLLWFLGPATGVERLRIPCTMVRDILEEYHDGQIHLGFHRAYEQIRASNYIRSLSKELRNYIAHCSKYRMRPRNRPLPTSKSCVYWASPHSTISC